MNLDALTDKDIRAAARRVREEGRILTTLFDRQRDAEPVYWVFDANIAHLYFDPHHHSEYASPVHAASARGKKAKVGRPAETALASVLADFLFSDRFVANQPVRHPVDPEVMDRRIVLEPHATELHEAFVAIRKKSLKQASGVVQAITVNDGPFQRELRREIDEFKERASEDASPYVNRVQALIRKHLKILLPDEPAAELARAKELLGRSTLLYESDIPWLSSELSSDRAVARIDTLTDEWYQRLMDASSRPAEDWDDSAGNDLQERRHAQNDAIALAKLQYLNETPGKLDSPRHFVFVSAHGLIHRAVKDSRLTSVSVLRPSVFLGSKHLFPKPHFDADDTMETGQWLRLTNSLMLMHDTSTRQRPSDAPKPTGSSDALERFKRDWSALLEFALPFLPAHSSNAQVQELASDLLRGESLRAFERMLYSALGDLLILSSEMSLEDGLDEPEVTLHPTPVPRLAFYPKAEEWILALTGGNPVEEGSPTAKDLVGRVRDEQNASRVLDFNYPQLMCLACWFSTLGHLRPARALVSHARAVVEVTSAELPLVTGREASYFESYLRRLQVRDVTDLQRAKAALQFFREAITKEEQRWNEFRRDVEVTSNGMPHEEIFIHRWRADLAEASIKLLEITLDHFVGPERANVAIASGLRPHARKFDELLAGIMESLGRVDVAEYVQRNDVPILRSVRDFSVCDGVLAACRCMLLIAASDPGRGRLGRLSSTFAALRGVHARLPSTFARFSDPQIELIACIWGKSNGNNQIVRESLGATGHDPDPIHRLRRFLLWVATQTHLVEN